MELLQKRGKRYGDIRPCNIHYSKQEEIIKILFTNYAKTAFDLILAKKIPYYKCFLAPEQLEIVGDQRPNEKSFDLIKCEIFSIAFMILSISFPQNKERIYNIQEPVLLYSGINSKLSTFKANYSNSFGILLEQMLSVNENLRPNLSELRGHINRYVKNQHVFNKLPTESTIPQYHTTHNSFDSNIMLTYYDKNLDSLSLQRMLNDSKSTKRTDKTTISFPSKEMLMLESKENSSLHNNVERESNEQKETMEIKEKDLGTGSISIGESEKKIPFFEKVKKEDLKNKQNLSKNAINVHRRNNSEVPTQKKSLKPVRLSYGTSPVEVSIEESARINNLIQKMEKKLLYEKNNPTVLKPFMEKIHYSDGSLYIGMMNNGIRQGKGIYYFSHKEIYGGDWKQDRFDGNGIYIYDNGDIYEGNLENGLKKGKGNYYYSNGDKYEGDWAENQKNGFGIFSFSNQEKFEGSWVNNEKNGAGVYYFSTGDKFEGIWTNGKKTGKGIVYFSDKSIFEGKWEENMPQGPGLLRYANGDTYEGSFICGMKEGEGVYAHEAGCRYEGTWRNDEQTGKGVLCYTNGDKYQGGMMNGYRFGYGIYWYLSGERYEGEWKENLKHGNGKLIIGKDSYYEGEWIKGKRDGVGIMVYENREKYEGSWKEDRKEGKGVYTWSNGTIYSGYWKGDKMNGEGRYVDEFGMEINGLWLNNEFWDKC